MDMKSSTVSNLPEISSGVIKWTLSCNIICILWINVSLKKKQQEKNNIIKYTLSLSLLSILTSVATVACRRTIYNDSLNPRVQ